MKRGSSVSMIAVCSEVAVKSAIAGLEGIVALAELRGAPAKLAVTASRAMLERRGWRDDAAPSPDRAEPDETARPGIHRFHGVFLDHRHRSGVEAVLGVRWQRSAQSRQHKEPALVTERLHFDRGSVGVPACHDRPERVV